MPARPGLVGAAAGGTLFLDEIGEATLEFQVRLLRVLDQGEYTRLGEARPRRVDLRLIGATNRPEGTLRADLRARMPIAVEVPGLNTDPEDVPLIARHLLRRIARRDAAVAERFFRGGHPGGHPPLDPALVAAWATHPWTTHARELEASIWAAIGRAPGDRLEAPPAPAAPPAFTTPPR